MMENQSRKPVLLEAFNNKWVCRGCGKPSLNELCLSCETKAARAARKARKTETAIEVLPEVSTVAVVATVVAGHDARALMLEKETGKRVFGSRDFQGFDVYYDPHIADLGRSPYFCIEAGSAVPPCCQKMATLLRDGRHWAEMPAGATGAAGSTTTTSSPTPRKEAPLD
jgi:hypothetical protein